MKIIKITESDLKKIVQKVLNEQLPVPTASRGQKGDEIAKIQQALISKGYDLGNFGPNKDGVDGNFGPSTQRAIKEFQGKMKLKQTGSIDQQTRNLLFAGFANSQFLKSLPGADTDFRKGQSPKTQTTSSKTPTKLPTTSSKSTEKPKTTTNGALVGMSGGSLQQSKDSGFILIFAFPEYQPKIDGDGKLMQFFGSVIRLTSGGGSKGTYGKQGHGGCVVIDSSGESTLYEFGRYTGAKKGYGKVLTRSLGRIAKIKNGVLTNPEEVAISARKKTYPPGPTMDMSVAVVKLPNPSGAKKYASVKEREYSIVDFSVGDDDANCGTFARDVASAGGVSMGTFCYPSPKAVVNSFRDKADKMFQV